MKLGGGYPMGPFELLDVVGLDVSLAIEKVLHQEFRDPGLAPAPLLEHLVAAGCRFIQPTSKANPASSSTSITVPRFRPNPWIKTYARGPAAKQ